MAKPRLPIHEVQFVLNTSHNSFLFLSSIKPPLISVNLSEDAYCPLHLVGRTQFPYGAWQTQPEEQTARAAAGLPSWSLMQQQRPSMEGQFSCFFPLNCNLRLHLCHCPFVFRQHGLGQGWQKRPAPLGIGHRAAGPGRAFPGSCYFLPGTFCPAPHLWCP